MIIRYIPLIMFTISQQVCLCRRGFQRHPVNGCQRAECSSDIDCSSDRTCRDGLCVNPCSLPNACGRNAQCNVQDHKAQCTCPSGYIGNPSARCSQDKDDCQSNPCGRNALCTDLVGTFECRCEPGCTGNPAKQGGCTCPPTSVDGCKTKICGPNAECKSVQGVAQCHCLSKFPHGNPEVGCSSSPGGMSSFAKLGLIMKKICRKL